MKYKRRSLEIEAIQFTRANWDKVVSFTDGRAKNVAVERCCGRDGKYYCWLDIGTGNIKVFEGEYISKDDFGTLYVYSQYPFENSFEAVEQEDVEEGGSKDEKH